MPERAGVRRPFSPHRDSPSPGRPATPAAADGCLGAASTFSPGPSGRYRLDIEQRPTAEHGETLFALVNGESVTLKRFYVEPDDVRLKPENPEMAPLYLRHNEIEI